MQKTYVLDTNVLIQAPYALQSFEDNRIVLPLAVLEELDGLKNAEGDRGANARQAIRYLEGLRTAGNLIQGVPLPGGGSLRLEVNCVEEKLPEAFPAYKSDNRILKVCLGVQQRQPPVILVTKDIVVRIKAQMLGIEAQDFTTEQAPVSDQQYTGRCQAFISEDKFNDFKKKNLAPEDLYQVDAAGNKCPVELVPNQFVILQADQSHKKTQLGRFDGSRIVPLVYKKKKPYGVTAPERWPDLSPRGPDDQRPRGAFGNCQRHGRHSQDLLFPGRGAARHDGAGGTGVPADLDQPAQRPV